MKEIYCFDVFPSEPLEEEQRPEDETPNGQFIKHLDYENQDMTYGPGRSIGLVYDLDHDFVSIKKHILQRPDFYEFFSKALDSYIDGDWVNAQSNIQTAQTVNIADGPMKWMTDYMESSKNLAPENWKGFRDLDMKQQAPQENFGTTAIIKPDDLASPDQDANPDSADATNADGQNSAR